VRLSSLSNILVVCIHEFLRSLFSSYSVLFIGGGTYAGQISFLRHGAPGLQFHFSLSNCLSLLGQRNAHQARFLAWYINYFTSKLDRRSQRLSLIHLAPKHLNNCIHLLLITPQTPPFFQCYFCFFPFSGLSGSRSVSSVSSLSFFFDRSRDGVPLFYFEARLVRGMPALDFAKLSESRPSRDHSNYL